MSNLILGRKLWAYLKVDTTYFPLFCGKSLEFQRHKDQIETTSVGSPNNREYRSGLGSGTLTCTGVSTSDNTNGRLSPVYLMQLMEQGELQDIKIIFTDENNVVNYIQFFSIITDDTISREVNSWSQCSATFLISGAWEIGTLIGSPSSVSFDVHSDWWTTSNGNNFINGASSGQNPEATAWTLNTGDIVLDVAVEGMGRFIILPAGTPAPGSLEVKTDLANHKLIFPADLIFDGTQRVYVQFKRPV